MLRQVICRTRVEHHFRLLFYVRYHLVHEFAHILLGHLGPMHDDAAQPQHWTPEQRERLYLPTEIKELKAETVAYLVCSCMGIRSSESLD